MAKRYRYAFAEKERSTEGQTVHSTCCSFICTVCDSCPSGILAAGKPWIYDRWDSLFAMLLSVYGFIMGLLSFSEENRNHRTSMVGSIANGMIMIGWLGIFLMGMAG